VTSPALSVLDLVPVRSGQTTGQALTATRSLAGLADDLGYRRYWLAEHHNMPAVAATNPPVLVAMVAGATRRIRVGSGGVMLPNHAPLVVAEQFALLEAAYPGRIDLGIGRAPGTDPLTGYALRHGAGGVTDEAVAHFPEYVDDVLAMMSADGRGGGVERVETAADLQADAAGAHHRDHVVDVLGEPAHRLVDDAARAVTERVRRHRVRARRAADAEVDPARVRRLEQRELLGHDQRGVVREHHAARPDPDA
jgi:alkanesulfonate monooxygenase SsuD/methylene tetrahydromethanopterin reductase-like flavin-dependent oxidoreductase (luciferase family)